MAPRRQCPVCGSKQWHKEPSSGLITCSEGHVLQNYRNETREVEELGPHAVRKRTLKSGRKKRERQSKADPKLYHGERARYHYFQCLQLVLRMQVATLRKLWDLPLEFEQTCRELWALHLSLLPTPPSAEPIQDSSGELGAGAAPDASPAADDSGAEDAEIDTRSESASSRTSESSDGTDSELEELMRENSASSSSSDDEGSASQPRPKPFAAKRRLFQKHDTPAGNIAVLVLACWTLRLPVVYMDFVRLIEAYDLPYLDTLRLLPEPMTNHLRKQTAQALSPRGPPSVLHLHRLSARLARLLYTKHGVHTPEMNATPILWRAVRCLCGTPTVYVLTKKLGCLVSIPLTLHRVLAPELMRAGKRDPTYHKMDNAVPEAALVAAVIVVLKLVYGLDGKTRQPKEKDDPACALPALDDLQQAIRDADTKDERDAPAFSISANRPVLDMDDAALDEYIDFCAKALLPRADRPPARNVTTDQFPVAEQPRAEEPRSEPAPLNAAQRANAYNERSEILRPGQQYQIYNTQDVLGSLPDELALVVSRAARWAGVDDDYLCGVVERFEWRVVRWWDGVKKKERGARTTGSDS